MKGVRAQHDATGECGDERWIDGATGLGAEPVAQATHEDTSTGDVVLRAEVGEGLRQELALRNATLEQRQAPTQPRRHVAGPLGNQQRARPAGLISLQPVGDGLVVRLVVLLDQHHE